MSVKLNPYINFKNQAREAITFYQSIFGGKLVMSTFGEAGMPADQAPAEGIMHAQLDTENGMTLMVSDAPLGWPLDVGSNMSISLSGDDEALLKGYWDKLSAGAKIDQPLEKAPWGDTFGMLTDKFGIKWMVNIAPKK
ncbi:MAG: 3-demethylubiquinone-9 3-methyltransferase, PhnB protein [Candidatus Paceibacter sp.]|jgi:PhnB protein|nr:3-demethylubiquinone-9 3-methyltransferase, PhnB protein [Candidatus Paceibacter sp.]